MSLTTSGAITLNPSPTANSGMASGASILTASTNVPTGYNVSLSATSAGANLSPTSGTITSPTALTNNTWGYALTKTGTSGAVGITNNFDTSYATPTPATASKWANPTTATTIKNTSAAAASDQTNIYYGAKADITLPSGIYTSTVTYAATANITTIPANGIISITPNTGTTAGGTQIAIVGTGFTANDQSVTTAVTVGGAACTGVSISSNTPATGQDTITCATPSHTAGIATIAVTTWKDTTTSTNNYTYIYPTPVITTIWNEISTDYGTTSGNIHLYTDITTNCKVNPTYDFNYQTGGTVFQWGESSTAHTTTVATTGGTNTFYVRCAHSSDSTVVSGAATTSVTISTTPPKLYMQNITTANCPTARTRANDYRDDATYWVQKLADGRCWMLTNLAYGGGGDNAYGDVKSISNVYAESYTDAYYYIPPGSNRTTGTTDPSVSTDGTGQYGYLYNYCSAMGAQIGTRACANVYSSPANQNVSVCPSGWRLPTNNIGDMEYRIMTNAIGATINGSGEGTVYSAVLRSTWLAMYSGDWVTSFYSQNNTGNYWSSSEYSYERGYFMYVLNGGVVTLNNNAKLMGYAVRCIAS